MDSQSGFSSDPNFAFTTADINGFLMQIEDVSSVDRDLTQDNSQSDYSKRPNGFDVGQKPATPNEMSTQQSAVETPRPQSDRKRAAQEVS